MTTRKINRRQAITTASVGALGALASWSFKPFTKTNSGFQNILAIKGGPKVREKNWPVWPVWDNSAEQGILEMLRTGNWWRGGGDEAAPEIAEFEKKYAELMGARRCLATASGTASLLVALRATGLQAGDEVLVSPYTFIATYNVVILSNALPVFVDTDPETFLINPLKIEERITDRTTTILPVHIYGLPADMDSINAIARKHNLKVVEDACQAWLAEYKGKKVGSLGDVGCFSFQNSKHLPSGEGGAIISDNDKLMDICNSIHNCGRPVGHMDKSKPSPISGGNYRMTRTQAHILLSQMKRIHRDADLRLENARYLDMKLREIPGIVPCKPATGATRAVYHLYPFRYIKEQFNDIPKETFIRALNAEGIPVGRGYGAQHTHGLIEEMLNSRGYQRLFSKKRLKKYREENVLPDMDKLVSEACTFTQNILLGSRSDMDDIVRAITKVYENRSSLK